MANCLVVTVKKMEFDREKVTVHHNGHGLPPATASIKTISKEKTEEWRERLELTRTRKKKLEERLARKQKKADQYVDGEYAPWLN
jgi:hypothetical protein